MHNLVLWLSGVVGLLGSPNQLLESATAGPAGPSPPAGSFMITESGDNMITESGNFMITET